MKKIIGHLAIGLIVFGSCTENEVLEEYQFEDGVTSIDVCASYEVLEDQIKTDPSLRVRMDEIEAYTKNFIKEGRAARLVDGVLEVPVQVNVLYRTTAENISNAQIQSQIDVLNEDFSGTNSDVNRTPSIFTGYLAGNTQIRFVWTSDNVTRKKTNKQTWRTNNDMKRASTGGIDPTGCSSTLNIWICNLGSAVFGYAQFPGGACSTDGVVINNQTFGRGSKFKFKSGRNKGRTATHEVGHYFNLQHIWGNTQCGDDLVNDTPAQNRATFGCPAFPQKSTCPGTPTKMTMNYMDYSNDACMYMFTQGQKDRMQATFALGATRSSLR